MPWKFCFPLPSPPKGTIPVKKDKERRFCVYLDSLVRYVPAGDPGPWITKGFIDEKLARDLPILATIDALASQLSNATARKTVQRAAQGAVDLKSLPENVKIEFE
jgi:hypothetical protein